MFRRDPSRPHPHLPAATKAEEVGLNEFLSGERTLRSDVLDRLSSAVDCSQALAQLPTAARP